MNRWNDIVVTLRALKEKGVDEENYQASVEEQFKFLGWSIAAGCVESKPVLPEGNSKSLIPDIVLRKNGERVLAVEVKEPNNKLRPRQEEQLFSYMRQLELRGGLYIGEKWQLYYNSPDDKEPPHIILSAPILPDVEDGITLCDLLEYDKFSIEAAERFCSERLKRQRYKEALQNKLNSWNEGENGSDYLHGLLFKDLTHENIPSDIVEEELSKVHIFYEYGYGAKKKTSKKKVVKEKKKLKKYSFNGGPYMFMTKIALEVVRYYIKKNSSATFSDIERVFPKKLIGSRAMVRKFSELQDLQEAGSKEMERYSWTPNERLRSADGVEFVVCTQWHAGNFPNLVKVIKRLKWTIKPSS